MSDGCNGCLTSPGGQAREIDRIRTIGEKYAAENKKTVAICLDGLEYFFCEADVAMTNNYQIKEVISKYERQ